jgi:hypothetical protein
MVQDSGGLQNTKSVSITPNRVDLTFTSNRSGIQIAVDGTAGTVPFVRSVPRKSQHTIFAASPQTSGGTSVYFSAWSDGGAQQHNVLANASSTLNVLFSDTTPVPTVTHTPTPTRTPNPNCWHFEDFLAMLQAWNSYGPPNPSPNWNSAADLDADNHVGFGDLLVGTSRWCG